MIQSDKGKVIIPSETVILATDLSLIIKSAFDMLSTQMSKEKAKEYLQFIFDSAFLSDEEIIAKADELEKELLERMSGLDAYKCRD